MSPTGDIWQFVDATALPEQAQVCAGWGDQPTPRVSIICLTFNHVAYLEDTLRGLLLQRTDFPFEILVFDDASTDGTSDIVRRYAAEYPAIIRAFIRPENTYSQGIMPRIFNVEEARGDYLAVCEGDDFWTDPNKLQVQFDFLEAHKDVVICGHDALTIDHNGAVGPLKLAAKHRQDATPDQLSRCERHILTLTMMYRNLALPEPFERNMVINGDSFLNSLIGAHGSYHFHADIRPAVYRVHPGGVWSDIGNRAQMENHANLFFWLSCFYKRHGNKALGAVFEQKFLTKSNDIRYQASRFGRMRLALRRLLKAGRRIRRLR